MWVGGCMQSAEWLRKRARERAANCQDDPGVILQDEDEPRREATKRHMGRLWVGGL